MAVAAALNTRSDRVGNQFRHTHVASENRSCKRPRNVSWPVAGKICEVRQFFVDDAPSCVPADLQCKQGNVLSFSEAYHLSRSAKRARMMDQDMDVPPGFCLSSAGSKSAQPKAQSDVVMAVTSRWHPSDKFICSDSWLWAGGEESSEVASQQERERRCLEAFYPRYSSIPNSPWEPEEPSVDIDDALVPQIPLVSVEEDEPKSVDIEHESEKGVTLPMSEPRGMPDEICQINDILHGIAMKQQQQPENVNFNIADSKIAAAAVAACMTVRAWGKSNLVDVKLLIEILKNPSLLKSLTNSHNSMERKHQDQGTNMQVAESRELPTDYAHKSRASVPVDGGDGLDIDNPHRVAASAKGSSRILQESANPTSRSMNLFSQRSLPASYAATLNKDPAQKRFEHTPRVHRHIDENPKMNSFSCPSLENGPISLLMGDLPQSRPMQAEPNKNRSAEYCKLPRKTNVCRMSSKTGGRAKQKCMYYNTPRGCRNGESCAFVHQSKPAMEHHGSMI